MDLDQNGSLTTSEFVEGFFNMQKKMIEDIDELTQRINEVEIREKEIIEKLAELKKSERYTGQNHPKFKNLQIMVGSILSIHVVDARDVIPTPGYANANSYLKLSVDGQASKTLQVANNNDPVWDEVIIFDIRTGKEKLVVQLFDVQGGFVQNQNLVG